MNTQKIHLGQHLLFQVPIMPEAFLNGVWTGINKHPKNSTWPTPNFQNPCKVRGVHELVKNGHSWTPKKYHLANNQFSKSLQGQRRSWTGYEWAFINTLKIPLGQHPIFQVPMRLEAFMNWSWMGIHERPKNTTWPTPTFPGTYNVRGVHELGMKGHSWTPKKFNLDNTQFSKSL